MQNLARFRTILKFGGEYLQNGERYSKSDNHSVYRDFSCVKQNKSGKVWFSNLGDLDSNFFRVRRNKFGEIWFSNLGDLDVKSYPHKAPFSENHISAPRGCCAPKFLHVLENDQVLLTHPPPGTGAPLTIFFKGGSKIDFNCNIGALITSELGGVARRNFGTWRVSRLGC